MALGFTNLETTGNTSNLTVYTTGSVTAAEGDVLAAWVNIVGGPRTGTLTASGLTWVPQRSSTYNTTNTIELHTAVVPAGGFTGTITITCSGGANQCQWSIVKVTGARITGGGPVVQCPAAATGTGTSGTQTLSAAADAANRTMGASGHGAFEGTTHPTGWTELGDSPQNSPACAFNSFYHPSSFQTSIQPSWTTSSGYGVLAAEFAILPAGVVEATIAGSFDGTMTNSVAADVTHQAQVTGSFDGTMSNSVAAWTEHVATITGSFDGAMTNTVVADVIPPVQATITGTFDATMSNTVTAEATPAVVIVTGATRYAPGWAGLASAARAAQRDAEIEAARTLIACPHCGTPLEQARGFLHCPLGDFTVPIGSSV